MSSYKTQLLKGLSASGWEQTHVTLNGLEWWADEIWNVRSIRESHGFEVTLTFLVDPMWEGPRKKGQGVRAISAIDGRPKTRADAESGHQLQMSKGRFDEQLANFLRALDRSRALASSTPTILQPVATAQLESWPTKRLLGLRDRLLRCEESLEGSDVQDSEELDASMIRFKEDPRWLELYAAVRGILGTREHVPGGTERALRRRERARSDRARDGKASPKRRGR